MLNIIVYLLLFAGSLSGLSSAYLSGAGIIHSFDYNTASNASLLFTIALVGLLINLVAIFSAIAWKLSAAKHTKLSTVKNDNENALMSPSQWTVADGSVYTKQTPSNIILPNVNNGPQI